MNFACYKFKTNKIVQRKQTYNTKSSGSEAGGGGEEEEEERERGNGEVKSFPSEREKGN